MEHLPAYSLPAKYYRAKVGEMQIKYSLPTHDAGENKDRQGAFYLTMARPLPGDGTRMDWNNKLMMKLSSQEISLIIVKARKELFPINLVHKSDNGTTSLFVEKGNTVANGDLAGLDTFCWTLKRGSSFAKTYLNEAQMHELFGLCEGVQHQLYGWGWLQEMRTLLVQEIRQALGNSQPQQAPVPASSGRDSHRPMPRNQGYREPAPSRGPAYHGDRYENELPPPGQGRIPGR